VQTFTLFWYWCSKHLLCVN